MKPRETLFLMAVAALVLGWLTHELVLWLRPKPPSPREIGLEWLRKEYHLPDDAYLRIAMLHEEYFVRCDEMCMTMQQSHRPLIQRSRRASNEESKTSLRKEKALCENCLDNMVTHLKTVAALMPPKEGERFLQDILPEVINPPELQKLRSQVTPLQ